MASRNLLLLQSLLVCSSGCVSQATLLTVWLAACCLAQTKEEPKPKTPKKEPDSEEKPKKKGSSVYHQFKNRDNTPQALGSKEIPKGVHCAPLILDFWF